MLKRGLLKDKSAVSEVVGTILILSITVVLFSTIFTTVSQLETPDRKTYTDMNAVFQEDNRTISITHQGGKSLNIDQTSIFIVVGDSSESYNFDMNEVQLSGNDDDWDIGEIVTVDVSGSTFNWETVAYADVMVLNSIQNQVIWNTEISIKFGPILPVIKESGVIYQQDWKDYVEAGNKVTLYSRGLYKNHDITDLQFLINLNDMKDYGNNGAWNTSYYNMSYDNSNQFTKTIRISPNQENGTYALQVLAHNKSGNAQITKDFVLNNSKSGAGWTKTDYISLNVGPKEDVREQPDIRVDENKMSFLPESPTSGDSLTVYAVIQNEGGSSAKVNVTVWDKDPDGRIKKVGFIPERRIAAGGGRDISASWNVNVSGEHNITVEVTNITSLGGPDLPPESNNKASQTIYVEPTILVVDDDHQADGESSIMLSALGGADFSLEYYEVVGEDGPPMGKINSYDIIVWITGAETQQTLTATDRENLKKYLDRGNKLWLIGDGIIDDIGSTSFIQNYAGIDSATEDSAPVNNRLNGTGILGNTTYLSRRTGFNGDYLTLGESKVMLQDGLGGRTIGNYFYNKEGADKYKIAFNSITLRSIRSGHSTMVYRVIKWLGNMTYKSGTDIAISSQQFSSRTPMYKEEVTINATVRNNGQYEESVDVRLFIDGQLDTTQRRQINLDPNGDYKEVSFEWVAQPVGEHDLVIKADPFDKIDETNEVNNDITYQDFNTNISVLYSVLIVDDDESEMSSKPNTTNFITTSLDRLDYSYDYVTAGTNPGPDSDRMRDYNSVYWVVGNASGGMQDTLLRTDLENIRNYLDNNTHVSLYLEGEKALDEILSDHGDYGRMFIDDYLGIDPDSIGELGSTPMVLKGINSHEITHGMEYKIDEYWSNPDFYDFSLSNGEMMFTDEKGNNLGSSFNDEQDNFKSVYSSVSLAHLTGPNSNDSWYEDFVDPIDSSGNAVREEFIYMMSKWLDNEDERVELRVSDKDISISNKNPMLGRSYQLSVSVENVGFTGSNALVRFKDGDSLIASESLYVPANGYSTAEVNWQPLYAGPQRPIRVLVDPLCTIDEIGNEENTSESDHMGFNNHGIIRTPVYYFWDDMENGSENWEHEATIANINGENPIDYLSEEYDTVYTDIIKNWDQDMSKRLNTTEAFSHSNPSSFWLAEPYSEEKITRKPIDIVMVIDTSGSMDDNDDNDVDPGEKLYDAKVAARNFIGKLTSKDRMALFTFDGGEDYLLQQSYMYMTESNKTTMNSTIGDPDNPNDGIQPDSNTPIWDTIGEAIGYSINPYEMGTGNSLPRRSNSYEMTMALTDGNDYGDGSYEEGSETFCPGAPSGSDHESRTWGYNTGVVWGSTGDYDNNPINDVYRSYSSDNREVEDIGDGDDEIRTGLINAPIPSYTIGLGISPHENDLENPSNTYFSFTTEFDLWQISETTGGSYYYAPDSSELDSIFQSIYEEASKEAETGNVTSVGINEINDMEINSNSQPELHSVTTGFSDGFESGDWSSPGYTGSWQVSSGTMIDDGMYETGTPLSGSYDASLFGSGQGGSNSANIYHNIDLSGISGNIQSIDLNFTERRYYAESTGKPSDRDSFYVEYSTDGGNNWFEIDSYEGSGGPNTRSYNITSDIGSSTNFEIRYRIDVNDDEVWHIDDVNIDVKYYSTIASPSITITSPNGGENWTIGSSNTIQWTTTKGNGTIIDVDLEYSTDNGASWNPIITGTEDDGSYSWTIPDDPSEQCLVKGTVNDDNSLTGTDTSDAFFTISEGGGETDTGMATGKNHNKTAVTPTFNLTGYSSSRLTFWNKYKILPGMNGGFLQIGYKGDERDGDATDWDWKYIVPSKGSYNGNLNMSDVRYDDFGNEINWCWNGVSDGGSFNWEPVSVNLLKYVPANSTDEVKIKFNYTQYGSGTGYGWYFDDVKIRVTRINDLTDSITSDMDDVWQLKENVTDRNGDLTTAWWNGEPGQNRFREGIDNSLITTPVDLTNAQSAKLSAYFKFNINNKSGAPPDGFRVEITMDNGVTWMPINLGVRTTWGVSGTGDNDSYEGENAGNYWTKAGSLTRLNIDLSDFGGETIHIRFRVVTNDAPSYKHYQDNSKNFGGFYIDDVIIKGRSIQE